MKMPTPREKPRRYMSASEYDRYVSQVEKAGKLTMRGTRWLNDPRDPSDFNEKTQIKVATGGRVERRSKIVLKPDFIKKDSGKGGPSNGKYKPKGALPGGKPGGKYKPKGTLPGGKPGKKDIYKGYNKGGTSPSTYKGSRP